MLLIIVQTIEPYILQRTRTGRRSKGIVDGCRRGNLAPLRGGKLLRTINGQATLIEFPSIVEHIFRNFAQIEIQIAAIGVGIALRARINERV